MRSCKCGIPLQIPFEEIQNEVLAPGPLLREILKFVQCHNFTLTQIAACNGLHEIERKTRPLVVDGAG